MVEELKLEFFLYAQNNSGGKMIIDDEAGIGPNVWIEAKNSSHANVMADIIGIYFNGCNSGIDCSCCGDRWAPAYEAHNEYHIDPYYDFSWHDTVYVHKATGGIIRIKKIEEVKLVCVQT